jgi:hypothetical protein
VKKIMAILLVLMLLLTACNKSAEEEDTISSSSEEPSITEEIGTGATEEEINDEEIATEASEESGENIEGPSELESPQSEEIQPNAQGILDLGTKASSFSSTVQNLDSSRIAEAEYSEVLYDSEEIRVSFGGIQSGPDETGTRRVWFAPVTFEAKFSGKRIIAGLADVRVNGQPAKDYIQTGPGLIDHSEPSDGEKLQYNITSDTAVESLDVKQISFSFDIYYDGRISVIGTRKYDIIWNVLDATTEDSYRNRASDEERIAMATAPTYDISADGTEISLGETLGKVLDVVAPNEGIKFTEVAEPNSEETIVCQTAPFIFTIRNSTRFDDQVTDLEVIAIEVTSEPLIRDFKIVGDIFFNDSLAEVEKIFGTEPQRREETASGTVDITYRVDGRDYTFKMIANRVIGFVITAV